jgi:colanic acid/amylovoran biosynthesis protein
MEFGNIGNYYILEPLIRGLREAFPDLNIRTTFQLSHEFSIREGVECLPMEYYYGWTGSDLENAKRELMQVEECLRNHKPATGVSPYVDEVIKSDIVIDFSGDIWGDNATFLGKDRFEVGLIKDRIAQILNKPTAMIAGSPGPFNDTDCRELAKETYRSFNLVTNREDLSKPLLEKDGFDVSKTYDCACPAFLFSPTHDQKSSEIKSRLKKISLGKPLVGLVVCGWNFAIGPFDKWPREDFEFEPFIQIFENLLNAGAFVVCMSHSNGFDTPPQPFRLKQGRDFPIAQKIYQLAQERFGSSSLYLLEDVLLPGQIKSVIGSLDFLVSGRVHAAVAGLSQGIPTAIIDYGHEPKAHKLRGFARAVKMEDCVLDPLNKPAKRVEELFANRACIASQLASNLPETREMAKRNFNLINNLI